MLLLLLNRGWWISNLSLLFGFVCFSELTLERDEVDGRFWLLLLSASDYNRMRRRLVFDREVIVFL